MDDIRYNISRDGLAYRVTSATRVGGTRRPRTHQKFSPVLITRADGSQSIIAAPARNYNGRRKSARVVNVPRNITAADLRPIILTEDM